ncbi:MAG: cell division ATP-binding protein FtsE [bacterium]
MIIHLENVTLTYPTGITALKGVNFQVRKNDFIFLVGESGSGKTSLFRVISREQVPQQGRVIVLGQDLRTIPTSRIPCFRRNIGILFQDFRMLPHRTVWENVALTLQIAGLSRKEVAIKTMQALEKVGLEDKAHHFPNELSGGELQKSCLARAIVHSPPILLADEPTGNLDEKSSIEIVKLLQKINLHGTTVLVATHDTAIVNHLNKPVMVMSKGTLLDNLNKEVLTGNI